MTRLLYIGDYGNTGFGTVAKGLLRGLHRTGKYDILQMGINYHDIDTFDDDWKIVPAGFASIEGNRLVDTDPYGFIRINYFLNKFDPDIVFINNDFPVAKRYLVADDGKPTLLANHRAKKILYAPIDSDPIPEPFVDVARMFDLNIAYTDWQRRMMAEHDPLFSLMPVLYHGYNPDVYFPMDKNEAKRRLVEVFVSKNNGEGREEFEKRIIDRFLVYFVGANQFRKDLPCLFRAFSMLVEDVPEASLIPHTDSMPKGFNGWELNNLSVLTGIPKDSAIIMGMANVFSEEEMNIFYNAADVLAYPTRGEGFGLPSLEAMMTKTPVAATEFAASYEIHSNGRGYPVQILDVIPKDIIASSYLVLPDHRSLYKQLKFIHDNPEHVRETTETAYEWAKEFTWSAAASKLDSILDKIPERVDASDVQKEEENNYSDEDPGQPTPDLL